MKTKFFTLLLLSIMTVTVTNAQTKGYEKSIEVGGSFGLSHAINYGLNISMINGYRFNDFFALSAGVGYKYADALYSNQQNSYSGIDDSYEGRNLVQVFARAKANLSDNNIAPFFQCDLGTSIDMRSGEFEGENINSSGLLLEPAFGIDFKTKSDTNIYLTVGYGMQRTKYMTWESTTHEVTNVLAGNINIKLGFVF